MSEFTVTLIPRAYMRQYREYYGKGEKSAFTMKLAEEGHFGYSIHISAKNKEDAIRKAEKENPEYIVDRENIMKC